MDIHDIYNAALGFNTTEKDSAGRVISRPVKPVFVTLERSSRKRQPVGFLQQLAGLLRMSAVQMVWQYDGIAVTLTMRPQAITNIALADVSVSQGSTTATLGIFPVTFQEEFFVPPEVIQALEQEAGIKH